jgi:hypothetical protein
MDRCLGRVARRSARGLLANQIVAFRTSKVKKLHKIAQERDVPQQRQ